MFPDFQAIHVNIKSARLGRFFVRQFCSMSQQPTKKFEKTLQNKPEIVDSGSALIRFQAGNLERYAKSLYTWRTQQMLSLLPLVA
jgi:hypothetical protein